MFTVYLFINIIFIFMFTVYLFINIIFIIIFSLLFLIVNKNVFINIILSKTI